MIPKTIHYCWFGGKPLPESAKKCIAAWRKWLPDYEIKEWNESNFDINSIPYTKEAYSVGKYAFVSDYARFKILYEHGGLYFDTDVEVIAPMDDIIAAGPFMGFEIDPMPGKSAGAVNPGLGLNAVPGMDVYKDILEYYGNLKFIKPDGSFEINDAVVNITTRELVKNGLKEIEGLQKVCGITIYPSDFFNPFDDATGKLYKTENTRSIHWFSKTWLNVSPARQYVSRLFHRIFGVCSIEKIRKFTR